MRSGRIRPNTAGAAVVPRRDRGKQRILRSRRPADRHEPRQMRGSRLFRFSGRSGASDRTGRRHLSRRRVYLAGLRSRRTRRGRMDERARDNRRRTALPDAERASRNSIERRADGPGTARLIANRASFKLKFDRISKLVKALEMELEGANE